MAGLNCEFKWQRRSALYTPMYDRPNFGLKGKEPVPCKVWGCYQVNDGDDVNPYFIIELEDGRCTYASPETIQFVEEGD